MDVTFTNVLEGARQYFQGLPMGTNSTASPIYPCAPDVQQRTNNEPVRNQEIHQSPNPYWMGQNEHNRLPSRDPNPTQRPPSYNSDSSRPPSHPLYAGTTQEHRTSNYPSGYQEQSSHFTQQTQQNQQQHDHHTQQQPQQVNHQQQIQQQHQQQQINQQHINQDFQFTRPHFRDAPSNISHHTSSHILQNPAYHHPSSPHNSVSPHHQPPSPHHQTPSPHLQSPSPHHQSPSPKQQRKVESNVNTPISTNHTQMSTSATSSTNYTNYQQSRTYYPVSSYTNIQTSTDGKNYTAPHAYSYPQPSQVNNSNYYKNVYQPQSSSSSTMYNSSTVVSHPSNPDQQLGVNYNQSSRTHNLPPIAQLSDSYSKSVRENQKLNVSRSQSSQLNTSSSLLSAKNSNAHIQNVATPNISQPPLQDYKIDYQFQNRAATQQYSTFTSSVTATSTSYNTVTTCRSNNSFTVQTLSSTHQFPPKVSSQDSFSTNYSNVNLSHQSTPSLSSISPTSDRKRLPLGGKQKRESPLDLSVKTVRTPADSTLDDSESDRSQFFSSNRIPPVIPSNYSTYDYGSSYQRSNNTQRIPPISTASAPKVDFSPNFSVSTMGNTQQNYRPEQRSTFQHTMARNPRHPFESSTSTVPHHDAEMGTNRYPVVSIPTIANVNTYMQSSSSSKNTSKVLPRIDFPTVGQSLKNSVLYPSHNLDQQRKRPADTAPSIPPKVSRMESWRQTIDQQIEQKLSTYKQVQQPPKQQTTSKSPIHNGNYVPNVQDRSKEAYGSYGRSQYPVGMSSQTYNMNQFNVHPSHSQTYVPTPANNQFGVNSNYLTTHQNSYVPNELTRSNSNSSLSTGKLANSGGAADKRVLTLLRNSIETKGVKEAQRKYEQKQTNKYSEQPHHRSDIQHPSTHVTAPLQPKPAFMGRQNVSPFTPNSLPEGNNTTPIYNKLHVPRAVDSINFEMNKGSENVSTKQLAETMLSDQNNSNGDLDGLAAFLAARIRTKAELKQVGPTQQVNNNGNNQFNNVIENQITTPLKQDNLSSSFSSGSSISISPPKLSRECFLSQQPRKRLFSRTEDDNGNLSTKGLPPRDKSGMRSSSETSVFDFPDSGSDGEMPVLEMQSLNAMRKDRKSTVKQSSSTEQKEVAVEEPNAISLLPEDDDIFLQACDTFLDQLKAGIGKKRGRRKKPLEPDVLAKLETATKEKPIDGEVKVKEEILDNIPEKNLETDVKIESDILLETSVALLNLSSIFVKPPKQPEENLEINVSEIKIELPDAVEESIKDTPTHTKVREELSDSDSETIKQLSNKLKNKALNKSQQDVKIKQNELMTLSSKPIKKPSFGDGSAFYPGWEEEVYKYKKSLRMPPSLIQVTRPPSSMRHSTSLPDLDPCPSSPTSSSMQEKDEDSSSIFAKVKSEPIDSDSESNSSFNLFNNKHNYDSEGSASIKSLPVPVKDSIVDKLLQKCGKRKKRKYKKKDEEGPKIIPKAENPVELLPTPSLEIQSNAKVAKDPVIKTESPILGFRKSTIENFKDAFFSRGSNIVGVNEQFSTVILKSRTRKETRVLKQRATIKEVFGEDRPASAPPVTCIDAKEIKKEVVDTTECKEVDNVKRSPRHAIRNKFLGRGKTKNNLLKCIADRKLKTEFEETASEYKDVKVESRDQSPSTISEDLDSKSETPSLDGDDNSNISTKKRGKFNKMRRKFSSGFDYIRKKKKQVKKENEQNEIATRRKRRDPSLKPTPESEQDIQKEIKSWVLNKGIGETHLHRSARLGYTDITAFCLEKMECSPSPKDNAGYTPLHEACSRGHLDIARLLLLYGANVSESAKGGVRPLHEAVENGFLEMIRLLLSYGADPKLATYAGLTPLSLATDDATKQLLQNYMDDVEGSSQIPWVFNGPALCFDPKENGCDIFSSPPQPDPVSEEEDIEFEVSESLLPNLYTLRGEPQGDRWVLLQDLSNILKIKSRDALLKQLCPVPTPGTTSNYRSFLRELKMSDFLEQAHCCQFLNASEKINSRSSKIALVKYTDRIRELLKIEKVMITAR